MYPIIMNDPRTVQDLLGAWPSGPEHIRPCLVGYSGVGKTYAVRQFAQSRELPLYVRLLATELPEEFLGVPVRHEAADGQWVVRWAHPQWLLDAAARPSVIFLDELDKARQETLAAALTLLWTGEVHGVRLHPETVIVAAMQPVDPAVWLADETGQALSGRLCFIPLESNIDSLLAQTGMHLTIPDTYTRPKFQLPVSPWLNQRTLHWFITNAARFSHEQRTVVACGLFPQALAEELLSQMRRRLATAGELLKLFLEKEELRGSFSLPELTAIAIPAFLEERSPAALFEIIYTVWTGFDEPDRALFMRRVVEQVADTIGDQVIDIWPDVDGNPDELLAQPFQQLVKRIIDAIGVDDSKQDKSK